MIFNFLKELNWVDIFVVILLIRMCYISVKSGFVTELFKLFGTVCAIYLACHYYIRVSNSINSHIALMETELAVLNFLAFFVLAFLSYLVIAIFRMTFLILMRTEAVTLLNRWGALMLGIVRCALLTSLLFFAITISGISYFNASLSNSFSSHKLLRLTPRVYTSLWNTLMFRFTGRAAFNEAVFEVGTSLSDSHTLPDENS